MASVVIFLFIYLPAFINRTWFYPSHNVLCFVHHWIYTEGIHQLLTALNHWGSLSMCPVPGPPLKPGRLAEGSRPPQSQVQGDETLPHRPAVEAMWPALWCRNLSQGTGLSSRSLTLVAPSPAPVTHHNSGRLQSRSPGPLSWALV